MTTGCITELIKDIEPLREPGDKSNFQICRFAK